MAQNQAGGLMARNWVLPVGFVAGSYLGLLVRNHGHFRSALKDYSHFEDQLVDNPIISSPTPVFQVPSKTEGNQYDAAVEHVEDLTIPSVCVDTVDSPSNFLVNDARPNRTTDTTASDSVLETAALLGRLPMKHVTTILPLLAFLILSCLSSMGACVCSWLSFRASSTNSRVSRGEHNDLQRLVRSMISNRECDKEQIMDLKRKYEGEQLHEAEIRSLKAENDKLRADADANASALAEARKEKEVAEGKLDAADASIEEKDAALKFYRTNTIPQLQDLADSRKMRIHDLEKEVKSSELLKELALMLNKDLTSQNEKLKQDLADAWKNYEDGYEYPETYPEEHDGQDQDDGYEYPEEEHVHDGAENEGTEENQDAGGQMSWEEEYALWVEEKAPAFFEAVGLNISDLPAITEADLRRANRVFVRKNHPDKNRDDREAANERTGRANEAMNEILWWVLGVDNSRSAGPSEQ